MLHGGEQVRLQLGRHLQVAPGGVPGCRRARRRWSANVFEIQGARPLHQLPRGPHRAVRWPRHEHRRNGLKERGGCERVALHTGMLVAAGNAEQRALPEKVTPPRAPPGCRTNAAPLRQANILCLPREASRHYAREVLREGSSMNKISLPFVCVAVVAACGGSTTSRNTSDGGGPDEAYASSSSGGASSGGSSGGQEAGPGADGGGGCSCTGAQVCCVSFGGGFGGTPSSTCAASTTAGKFSIRAKA